MASTEAQPNLEPLKMQCGIETHRSSKFSRKTTTKCKLCGLFTSNPSPCHVCVSIAGGCESCDRIRGLAKHYIAVYSNELTDEQKEEVVMNKDPLSVTCPLCLARPNMHCHALHEPTRKLEWCHTMRILRVDSEWTESMSGQTPTRVMAVTVQPECPDVFGS